jgi:hypothetical protein
LLTPYGYATEKDGRLFINNPAAHQLEWQSWCLRHNNKYLIGRGLGHFEYTGPIIVESDSEIPEGYEEWRS